MVLKKYQKPFALKLKNFIFSENFIQNLFTDIFNMVISNFQLGYQFIALQMPQLRKVLLLGASMLTASES